MHVSAARPAPCCVLVAAGSGVVPLAIAFTDSAGQTDERLIRMNDRQGAGYRSIRGVDVETAWGADRPVAGVASQPETRRPERRGTVQGDAAHARSLGGRSLPRYLRRSSAGDARRGRLSGFSDRSGAR